MNRIYQGRVQSVEINFGNAKQAEWQSLPDWEDKLWQHHCIFQDAVNYYLVALAALADPKHAQSRLSRDLQERIHAAWHTFPRSVGAGARGLKESLTKWLDLPDKATPEDAYTKILPENEATPEVRALALELLLDKCGGESAIQQGGRGYFPRFCDSANKPSWDFSKASLIASSGKDKLSQVLHSYESENQLVAIANELELSWTVKIQPDALFTSEEATNRVKEGIEHTRTLLDDNESQRIEALKQNHPNYLSELDAIEAGLKDLKWERPLPRNRKASKDLTFATILFMRFPSPFTADLLALFIAKPKDNKANNVEATIDFTAFDDDPIKLARGNCGFVFPAFSALPAWAPKSQGQPVWKEFDIAAFKEALKSLNQFSLKTEERQSTEQDLRGQLAIMLGSKIEGWKPKPTDAGEEGAKPEPLKPELFKLARELEAQLTKELDDSIVGEPDCEKFGEAIYTWCVGEWRISRSSLRGLREIVEEWNKILKKNEATTTQAMLEDVVKKYQADEKHSRSIGSIPLFLHLCDRKYWPLWNNNLEEDEDDAGGSFLYRMAIFHNTFRDFQRSQEPINLTPAEPVYSRRLYMFSDLKDKLAKVTYGKGPDANTATCAIVVKSTDGILSEQSVRLRYSGKRLLRDELQGGESSRWLQPMTKALGISEPVPTKPKTFDSAMSLMPDFARGDKERLRFLLNFPVTLEPSWIHAALGKAAIWDGQFNGVKDKNLHLHWPGTIKGRGAERPWWKDNTVIANGFTCISIDLGQRTAGAYALLHITCTDPREDATPTKRPVREVGFDGERHWFAEVTDKGILRLPGEDQRDGRTRTNDKPQTESFGKAGRNALEHEWEAAKTLATALLADKPENWVGKSVNEKSFPEQNDALIALANRRLSRLNTFHRWSCFDPDRHEIAARRDKLIEKLKDELSHWQDADVQQWKVHLANDDYAAFSKAAGEGYAKLRVQLGEQLITLANRTAPLRDRSWEWKPRKETGGNGLYGELLDTGPQLTASKTWIRGQRGLSMQRIEQLENLRKLFLRYNRSFDREPGKPAEFGFADRGRDSGEPCRLLLGKIDRMKEQRINQTAHLILAEALGVRLREHQIDRNERKERDIHGEYEKIPSRQPVDFIVIENLDRYLTSQGRAPSENSRLMKWAHRAVREKIKMLSEEPFGIPVVETAAAYSSRFSALTSAPGSRCEERAFLDNWSRETLKKRSEQPKKHGQPEPSLNAASLNAALLKQFEQVEAINQQRKAMQKPPHSLLLPKVGGPLFLPLDAEKPWQADINAAMNLGLRAVAAPDALHLLHKVRTERDKKKRESIRPLAKNAREKAAFQGNPNITLSKKPSDKLDKAINPNFFYNHENLAEFDSANLTLSAKTIPLASGVGLWATVNQQHPGLIVNINQKRLAKWLQKTDDDDIPM